jgi:hypothetical protein
MFTVKWIADNGSEMLYQAKGDISYSPGRVRGAAGADEAKACVAFTDSDGVHCSIDAGDIFVMNELGKTVARYALASEAFPRGLAPSPQAA